MAKLQVIDIIDISKKEDNSSKEFLFELSDIIGKIQMVIKAVKREQRGKKRYSCFKYLKSLNLLSGNRLSGNLKIFLL